MERIANMVLASSAVIGAVSALAGAIIAGIGLRTWRRELLGRVEYDLARRLLKGVFELRNAIRQVRSVWATEGTDARCERVDRKRGELDASLLEAEVLWGGRLQQAKRQLKECLDILGEKMALRYEAHEQGLQLTDAEKKEMTAILCGHGRKDDQFGQKVDAAVRAFEDVLRPHLSR